MKNDNFSEHVTLQVMLDGTTMGPMSPPTLKGLLINYLYIKKPAKIHVNKSRLWPYGRLLATNRNCISTTSTVARCYLLDQIPCSNVPS